MPTFFPPQEEVASAGESHRLTLEEANYAVDTGTFVWDGPRGGYVLAPGKTWNDYVRDMNVVDPPNDYYMYDREDDYYDDWGHPEDFD